MVTQRIWKLVAVGLVVALLGGELAAAEPVTPAQPKSECRDECARRAKAAFAFAKLKAEATAQPAPKAEPPAAPAPRPGSGALKVSALRACACDSCECADGTCPACPAVRAPAPAPTVYREVWYTDGRRTWRVIEPVAGTSSPSYSAQPACPNGRCPLR